MSSALISSSIALASQIFQFVNSTESLTYVKQLEQHQMDLVAEKAKGYQSDDAMIETLEQQITVLLEAANNAFQAIQGKLPTSSPVTTPASQV